MNLDKWMQKPKLIRRLIGRVDVSTEPSVTDYNLQGEGGFTFHHIYPGSGLTIEIQKLDINTMKEIVSVRGSLYPNPDENPGWWDKNEAGAFKENLKSALYWAPGNLCLGPRLRSDDPKSGIETYLRNGSHDVNGTVQYLKECMVIPPKSTLNHRTVLHSRPSGTGKEYFLAAQEVSTKEVNGNYYELDLLNLIANWEPTPAGFQVKPGPDNGNIRLRV